MTDDLYRDITGFAHDTPSWFQHLAEVWTELGLLLFGVLFIVAWWRARSGEPRALAVAVLAPLGTAVAYVCSELFKSGIQEERPCRAVTGALRPLVECPPHGDWSFPSNHSTIAGAAAVGLALAWPRIAALTVPMAVLMAFSRVFVGVHYPHDVAVGLLFGAVIVFVLVRLATRPVARITLAMRGSSTGVVQWFAGPGPRGAATAPAASTPAAVPAPGQGQQAYGGQGHGGQGHGGQEYGYGQQGRDPQGYAQHDGYQSQGYGHDANAYASPAYAAPHAQEPNPYGPRAAYDPNGYDATAHRPDGYQPGAQDPNAYAPDAYAPDGYGSDEYASHGYDPNGYVPDGNGQAGQDPSAAGQDPAAYDPPTMPFRRDDLPRH